MTKKKGRNENEGVLFDYGFMALTGGASKLVNEARHFVCTLYKAQPGALVPNIIEQNIRLVWDTICDPGNNPQTPTLPGLPPKPSFPFTGGQCNCIRYRVTVTASGGGLGSTSRDFSRDVFGPITSIKMVNDPGGLSVAIVVICKGNAAQCGVAGQQVSIVQFGNTPSPPAPDFTIKSVVRIDNLADNCGNPTSNFPPEPPVPAGGFNSVPTPIVLNDSDTINVVFNLTPPRVVLPSLEVPSVIVNVSSPGLKTPISFNFDGTVNIGTPPQVGVDLSGITDVLDVLSDNVNNLAFNYNNPTYSTSTQVDVVSVPSGKEGDKESPELLGLLVELTKFPDKAQFGSPTCYFAGWLTFKNQGGYELRHQINFASSYLPAPVGCTGYAYTFTNGAEGAIREYRKVKEG